MSVQVGKIQGIPIRLHFTLVIAIVLISFTLSHDFMPFYFPGLDSMQYWIIGITGAVIMFLSVLVHELAHSILAQRYGVKVREIILFVFGGVSDISEELKDYRKEFKMALAGPATSFVLGSILTLAFIFFANSTGTSTNLLVPILYYSALLNAVLGIFNLIPAFPSDGGRILRAILVRRNHDYNKATRTAAKVGIAISFGFMVAGVVILFTGNFISGAWIILIGWFLRSGAESYLSSVQLGASLGRVRLQDIMNTNVIAVKPTITADELMSDYFHRYLKGSFPVVNDARQIEGLVTLAKVAAIPKERMHEVTARNIMLPRYELIIMHPEMTAEDALALMTSRRLGKIMVCNKEGELVGIVSKTDLLNVEMERQEIVRAAKVLDSSNHKLSR